MDEDADRARDAIRTQIAPFLRGGGNAVQLRVAGIEAEVAALVGGTADDMALGRAIPEEWLDLLAVAGNAEQCAAAVDRLRAAGADAVVLVPPERVDTGLDQLAAFARTVLPRAVA
jgi:5,10-methylenetetrahydromethanopterin reductase